MSAWRIHAPRKYVRIPWSGRSAGLERCIKELDRLNKLPDTVNPGQVLFGINQGGTYDDLRIWHMQQLRNMPVAGVAIGGLAVGEPTETMYHILDVLADYAPEDKPRYLMGVARPAISRGGGRGS